MKALKVKISADAKGFNSAVSGAGNRVDKFAKDTKKSMLGVAAVTAGAVAVFSKWADKLDRIGKLAARLRVTTESIQRIGFAAGLAGADLETVVNALTKIQQNAGQAINGLKSYGDAFERLGIDAKAFIAMKPEDQILLLSEAYQKAQKTGTGVADVLLVLGGRSKELLPLLSQNRKELEATFAQASVTSNSVIKNAERMNDVFATIKNGIAGWAGEAVQTLLAIGIDIAAFVNKTVQRVGAMFDLLADSAQTTAKLVQAVFLSDFKGAKAAYAELGKIVDDADAKLEKHLTKIDEVRDLALVDLYSKGEVKKPQISIPLEDLEPVKLETPTDLLNSMKNLGDVIMDSLKGSLKPTEAKKKEENKTVATFSAITAKRGQSISSLASHGGGRGMKGAMSGLTKVALESQRVLERIAMNTGKPLQTVLS